MHFLVLVIGENPEQQLQKYHEFEATEDDDEYVLNIDVTNKIITQMSNGDSLRKAIYGVGLDTECITNDENNINISDDHRFGYVLVKNGKVIKAIKRTNPNGKWAGYQLGGRFDGFKLKLGKISPVAFKKDIDFTQFNVTYAVIKDSQWFSKEDIEGSSQEAGEKWRAKYWEMVNSAHDDTLFCLYDCHT